MHNWFKSTLILPVAAWAAMTGVASAQEANVVRVTDEVLVPEVERLGVHFGGHNFYDSVILKQRVAENFEGTIRRLHVLGDAPQPDPDGMYLFGEIRDLNEDPAYVGAKAYVLSGPDQFEERTVVAVETREHATRNRKGKTHFVRLDKPVEWGEEWMNGLLLEASDRDAGQDPWLRKRIRRENGERTAYWEHDKQYITPDTTRIMKDAPEEVGGAASLLLDAREGESWVKFRVQFWDAAPYAGVWNAQVWAKARAGKPTLTVKPTVPGTSATITPTREWQLHDVQIKLEPNQDPDQNPIFMLQLEAEDGAVLIDNVQLEPEKTGDNPTPFRDELVSALKPLQPGSMRLLRNHRDTFVNSTVPRIMSYSRRGENARRSEFGTHEYYELCAHLGANPWDAVSGTLLPQDIDDMMEYHAAPADVGKGKLRAELGQEEPWTEVFDKIHLQFGNEAITFFGTGYYGPDYWQALVTRAKNSPYYDPDKFVFHLNEQGAGLDRLFRFHPDFDRGTINGYHIFGVYRDQVDKAGDIPGFYDWVFASAWHMWMVPDHNKNWNNLQASKKHDKEISIYEGGNYHSTFSTPDDAPIDRINHMLAGKAGGVSAINTMLILLKEYGARTQQNFNLSQHTFSPGGAFGNLPGRIRGWGGILNIGNPDTRRYRPRFQAIQVANEVIGGDLVATELTGPDLAFDVTNRFGAGYGPSRNPEMMTVEDVPRIHTYAFKEGGRRGLVLVSADPRDTREIEIQFDGQPEGSTATTWLLDSPDLEDTNEPDWAPRPRVQIEEGQISGFQSGTKVDLPPGTILAIEWNVAE
ncbi:MAG: hypothetical protein ACLFV3_03640 [Phycisphaeraceae bacterium]